MTKPISKRLIVAKKKMQDVDFKNVDDLPAFIPENELKIVERLRKIIFSCLPGCTEKLAYNVPFYKVHANICFIWPPSVNWGGKARVTKG
jgi:hypothetical protein